MRTSQDTARVDGKSCRPIGDDLRVIDPQQLQVEAAARMQIDRVVAGHAHGSLRRHVSVFTHQVQLLQPCDLCVHGKTHRAIVLQLHVLYFGGKLAGHAGHHQVAGPPEGTVNIHSAGNR